jgi:hypothetical protein
MVRARHQRKGQTLALGINANQNQATVIRTGHMGAHAQEVTVQVQVTPGGQTGEPIVGKIAENHASGSRAGLGDHTLGPR